VKFWKVGITDVNHNVMTNQMSREMSGHQNNINNKWIF